MGSWCSLVNTLPCHGRDRGFKSHRARLRSAEARKSEGELRHSYGVAKPANKNMYYVYSLKCKDGYYIGCTDNLRERLKRHESGRVPATANRLPVKLDFYFAIPDKYKVFKFEK